MPSLPIAISPNYIDWTPAGCVREFLQNAQDGERKGHRMTVKHFPRTDRLMVRTDGTILSPSSLVLGNTDKRCDDEAAGHFGEGYKLAVCRLLKLGHEVVIKNGNENWTPEIRWSDDFQSDILFFDTHRCCSRDGEAFIEYEISGITEEIWTEIKANTLFLSDTPIDAIECTSGRILTDARHTNKLLVKRLLVCQLPEPYRYGYDLKHVGLDRDRKLADPWSLKAQIKAVLSEAVEAGRFTDEQIYNILNTSLGESKVFEYDYSDKNNLHEAVSRHFKSIHGENVIPVVSTSESIESGHYGVRGIVVNRAIQNSVSKVIGDIETIKETKANSVERMYSADELTVDETDNFLWAIQTVGLAVDMRRFEVSVVDFCGKNVLGQYCNDVIYLARKIVTDREQLLGTLVHEVAHGSGVDGSVDHERRIERLFSKIICSM